MGIKLSGCESYTMRPSTFVWAFSPDGRTENVARDHHSTDEMSSVRRLTQHLLKRMHYAGWDVPGVDVHIAMYDGKRRGLFRYVEAISGEFDGKPFTFSFKDDCKPSVRLPLDEDGEPIFQDYIPGAFSRFSFDGVDFAALPEKWSASERDLFEDVVLSVATLASKSEPSPVAFDIDIEGDANIRAAFAVTPIPAPSDFPTLYCWVPIDELRNRPDGVVLTSTGWGLCSDTRPSDIPNLPKRYFHAFDYASEDIRVKADQGFQSVREESVPVEVKLRHLNEIYVMDMAARDRARHRVDMAISMEGRRQSNRDEICEVGTAAAKTMVPANEYRGGFERPVYVIGRHILSDEARFMRGVLRLVYEDEAFSLIMTDDTSGKTACFATHEHAGPATINDLMRHADWFGRCVGDGHDIEPSFTEEVEYRRAKALAKRQQPSGMKP